MIKYNKPAVGEYTISEPTDYQLPRRSAVDAGAQTLAVATTLPVHFWRETFVISTNSAFFVVSSIYTPSLPVTSRSHWGKIPAMSDNVGQPLFRP